MDDPVIILLDQIKNIKKLGVNRRSKKNISLACEKIKQAIIGYIPQFIKANHQYSSNFNESVNYLIALRVPKNLNYWTSYHWKVALCVLEFNC